MQMDASCRIRTLDARSLLSSSMLSSNSESHLDIHMIRDLLRLVLVVEVVGT